MTMVPLAPLVLALGLLAASVILHATMLVLLLRWYGGLSAAHRHSILHAGWLLVRVAWWIVMAHLVEMLLWALAYVLVGALPNLGIALYFSSVTYTTIGYGDVVLPARWHLLSGIEGLTGILMAGWSTAFLFAVIHRLLVGNEPNRRMGVGGDAS